MVPVKDRQEERKNKIIESSKVASEEMRKVIVALLITALGLAFKEKGFVFSSEYLKWAVVLFVFYFALDMTQYIIQVWKETPTGANSRISSICLFYLKFIPAGIGLILILVEIFTR